VSFVLFFFRLLLCNPSTLQPSFEGSGLGEINDCGAMVRSPTYDLRSKCHLCELEWDIKRLARMPRRSLDLAVTSWKATIPVGMITVILRSYEVTLLYGHYRQTYWAVLASDWLPSNWSDLFFLFLFQAGMCLPADAPSLSFKCDSAGARPFPCRSSTFCSVNMKIHMPTFLIWKPEKTRNEKI
jgi:hypothetical protein